MFSFFKKKPPAEATEAPAATPPAPAAPAPEPAPSRSVFSPSSWFGSKPAAEETPAPPPAPAPAPVAAPGPAPAPVPAPPPAPAASPAPAPVPAPPIAAPVPAPVAEPAAIATERKGWFDKLKTGLRKTGTGIQAVFVNAKIDEELYEELESALLMADTGVKATEYLLDDLRGRVKRQMATDAAQVKVLLAGHRRPAPPA